MRFRRKLFKLRNPYKELKDNQLFVKSVRENIEHHVAKCPEYKALLKQTGFQIDDLQKESDLYKLPPLPTVYLKNHLLFSKPYDKCLIKSESSGTSGKPSKVGLDKSTCYYGAKMLISVLKKHQLFSVRFHNYIILGYKPSKRNKMGAVKTAYGSTFLTPALHKEFAIIDNGQEYVTNFDGIKKALLRYEKAKKPVRILGFPSYTYFLIKEMIKSNIKVQLNKDSLVLFGGGWKQFFQEEIAKEDLYELIEEYLGIKAENCREFFGVVEHNVPYFDCKYHHFHVPVFGKVIIRDPFTMLPVENGTAGILNLITPLVTSMPITSILTDDLAILYDGTNCPCGNQRPYFEILGRVGHSDIKTCVNQAIQIIGGNEK